MFKILLVYFCIPSKKRGSCGNCGFCGYLYKCWRIYVCQRFSDKNFSLLTFTIHMPSLNFKRIFLLLSRSVSIKGFYTFFLFIASLMLSLSSVFYMSYLHTRNLQRNFNFPIIAELVHVVSIFLILNALSDSIYEPTSIELKSLFDILNLILNWKKRNEHRENCSVCAIVNIST